MTPGLASKVMSAARDQRDMRGIWLTGKVSIKSEQPINRLMAMCRPGKMPEPSDGERIRLGYFAPRPYRKVATQSIGDVFAKMGAK